MQSRMDFEHFGQLFASALDGVTEYMRSESIESYVVIGSGPAGWGALEALVAVGRRPILIDIGLRDIQTRSSKHKRQQYPINFTHKTRHGSSHMYSYPESLVNAGSLKYKVPLSGAFGGLSTVWGTNIQLSREACLKDLTESEYQAASSAVLGAMFHCGAKDDLEQVAEWPIQFSDVTPQSNRMRTLQARFSKCLSQSPYVAGMARNATRGYQSGCVLCGECMSGCRYGAIFSTENRINQLAKDNKIEVVDGIVTRVAFNGEFIEIYCENPHNKSGFCVNASTVFLAAGSLASAAILMRSELIPNTTSLRETQVAYVPILAPSFPASSGDLYTLAQVFIESRGGLCSESSFHLSLYEPSTDWSDRIKKVRPLIGRCVSWLIKRYLIAGICFLPSALSGQIMLRLLESGEVSVSIVRPKQTIHSFRTRLRAFRRAVVPAGIFPLVEMSEFPDVGSSFHVGVLEANGRRCLGDDGSVQSCPGLYVVDGASLQAMPAGPVTLSIMINATIIVNRISQQE